MESIILRTKRLELVSGTLEHARAEKHNRKKLPQLLNAKFPYNWPPPLNDDESTNYFLKYAEENPHAGGFTFWYIILHKFNTRAVIGNIGFKGMPTENGTVEVGYSIMETHQKKGYAPEALAALIKWAFIQPKVKSIIAETFPDLIPSQRVLEKNGFQSIGEGSEPGIIRYELKKNYPETPNK